MIVLLLLWLLFEWFGWNTLLLVVPMEILTIFSIVWTIVRER